MIEIALTDLNLLGEFTSARVESGTFGTSSSCTINVFADRLEVPGLEISVRYEQIQDIIGGTPEELNPTVRTSTDGAASYAVVIKLMMSGGRVENITLSSKGEGLDSIEYCEMLLYRAFAAHKVRSRNDGAPCHGIIGY
ncbi:MAG: hypothetical protein OK455_07530 [Thaumarchaeota archaeon]|nr:hypothetical protein [Nitrososphaerota archaeon]